MPAKPNYLHSTTSPVLGAIAMLPLTGMAISSLDRLTTWYPLAHFCPAT